MNAYYFIFIIIICTNIVTSNDSFNNNNNGLDIIVAGEEGKAVLPCLVDIPPNDSIELILWFRGDQSTALYSLDARSGSIQRAKHFPSDHVSSRAYIDTTTKPSSLVIDSVRKADAGEYRCRIDFRKARTQYRSVQLHVIVSVKEVIIMDEYGQRLRDIVGPYNEAAHLTLICEAEGGIPQPSLKWFKNSVLIDDIWTLTPQGIIRNEMVIQKLERSDLMATLTCEASNSNLTKSVSSSIKLDLNLKPLKVWISSLRRPLSAGKEVELICQSNGSRPPAIVTWWKGINRLPMANEDVSTHENLTLSKLNLTPVMEDNGKMLSCRADHIILPDSSIEDSWILDVYYVPRLSISFGASIHHQQVHEGSDVSFECHIQANPKITQLAWQFNSLTLVNDSSAGISLVNNSLFLANVRKEQSGKYRCVAANVEGEGHSNEVQFRVLYAPICKSNQKKIFGVSNREPIQVPCTFEADPPQVTFRWALNNSFQLLSIGNFKKDYLTSIATYSPRTKYGYGQLYCWASNKVGESLPCVFDIIAAGPPQPIRNCLIGNQSTDSLVIKCEPGLDGGLEQTFHLEVYTSISGILETNMTSKLPIFEVISLPKSTSFVLVLYAANAKGRSNLVALTASTLPFTSRDVNQITPVIAVLIGVIGSLLFTAIAIIIIARLRTIEISKDITTLNNNNSSNSSNNNNRNSDPSKIDIKAEKHCVIQIGQMPYNFDRHGSECSNSWERDFNQDHDFIFTDDNTLESSKYDGRLSSLQSTILRDNAVIMQDDHIIASETPLMNGLFFQSCPSSNYSQKHVSTLSTPV